MNCSNRHPRGSIFWWNTGIVSFLILTFVLFTPIDACFTQQISRATRERLLRQELSIAERTLNLVGSGHPSRARYERRVRDLKTRLANFDNSTGDLTNPRTSVPSKRTEGNSALRRQDKKATPIRTSSNKKNTTNRVEILRDTRRLVQMSDLELIGGWRIPPALQRNKSTAFSLGGITIESLGETNAFWITHHAHLGGVLRLTGAALGTGEPTKWPLLKESDYVPVTRKYQGLFDAVISGVFWDPTNERLWVSGRSHYAVPVHMGPWLVACERSASGNWTHIGPFKVDNATMQRNGGGFCQVSPSFATKYLSGRTLGLACGGYESGQGSSLGPTLTATFLSPDRVGKGKALLGYGWNCDETKREYRFPDYRVVGLKWAIPPNEERGYWFAEETLGGPAWIETDEVQGLCYFVREGVGDVLYSLQNQNFTKKSKSRMYCYSLNDLAEVAVGNSLPHEIHGQFEEFSIPKLPGIPRGACFDSRTGRLFVFMEKAWKKNVESYPLIAVFQVTGNPKP